MLRIIDGRSCGKTKRLLKQAQEIGAIVACSNPYAMAEKAKAYGFYGINCIHYDNVKDFLNKDILIDELELYASYITAGKLVGYTLSEDD